jgi:hypothetical protein
VVELSIGLDFVKNIDKNWNNRLISIDRMDENENYEKTKIEYNKDIVKENIISEKSDNDFWSYWKKRYSIIR